MRAVGHIGAFGRNGPVQLPNSRGVEICRVYFDFVVAKFAVEAFQYVLNEPGRGFVIGEVVEGIQQMRAVARVGKDGLGPSFGAQVLANLSRPLQRRFMLDIGSGNPAWAFIIQINRQPTALYYLLIG